MSEPRVIKRYSNRKLYDTANSRYVTLDQIGELVRGGEDVRIIDNNSKEDLTSVTLAQIIFEEEKRQRSFLPLSTLREIIRNGGNQITGVFTQLKDNVKESADRIRLGAEKIMKRDKDGRPLDDTDSVGAQAAETAEADQTPAPLRGLLNTVEDWQRRVDTRVRESVSRELKALRERIEEVERKVHGPGTGTGTE